jgi:hypothetical protein
MEVKTFSFLSEKTLKNMSFLAFLLDKSMSAGVYFPDCLYRSESKVLHIQFGSPRFAVALNRTTWVNEQITRL